MTLEAHRAANPDRFFLSTDASSVASRLGRLRVLDDGEEVRSVAPAGEGNMNLTVRVRTDRRSMIVKQSRPWVERFPDIPAPADRVLGEARFYGLAAASEAVAGRMPRLLEVAADDRLMVLEDLGEAADYTALYRGERLAVADARALAEWLAALHAIPLDERSRAEVVNLEMRRLNHEHIFRLPLDGGNDLDLDAITPGLRGVADELAADRDYVGRVHELGERYLAEPPTRGAALLHGDFFPGSWLRTAEGPAVIDPEFAFVGPTEFDVGVMLGHLHLARQDDAVHSAVVDAYRAPPEFNWRRASEYAAVEIMRRLIGVAQLPLDANLSEKRQLLDLSRRMLLGDGAAAGEGGQPAWANLALVR